MITFENNSAPVKTIAECIVAQAHGLHYGSRIILPFHANFLKVVIGQDVITDFSDASEEIVIEEQPGFTNLYFLEFDDIEDNSSEFETIKILAVEKNDSIFDMTRHKKLELSVKEQHHVSIKEHNKDILFID